MRNLWFLRSLSFSWRLLCYSFSLRASNRFQVYVAETITIKIDNAEATAAHKILLQKETNAIDIRKLIRTALSPRGNPRAGSSKRCCDCDCECQMRNQCRGSSEFPSPAPISSSIHNTQYSPFRRSCPIYSICMLHCDSLTPSGSCDFLGQILISISKKYFKIETFIRKYCTKLYKECFLAFRWITS